MTGEKITFLSGFIQMFSFKQLRRLQLWIVGAKILFIRFGIKRHCNLNNRLSQANLVDSKLHTKKVQHKEPLFLAHILLYTNKVISSEKYKIRFQQRPIAPSRVQALALIPTNDSRVPYTTSSLFPSLLRNNTPTVFALCPVVFLIYHL